MTTDASHGNDSANAEKAKRQSLFCRVNERLTEVNAQRAAFDVPQDVIFGLSLGRFQRLAGCGFAASA
jgi:hypothetical protein